MAVQTYSYTDTSGSVQTVDINITDYGVCKLRSGNRDPRQRYTTYKEEYYRQLTFTLSKPLPSPIKVYAEEVKIDHLRVAGPDQNTRTVFFEIPRGTSVFKTSVNCKTVHRESESSNKIYTSYSHNIIAQPEGDTPADEEKPLFQTDIPFSDTPLYFFEFTRNAGDQTVPCRVEIMKRGTVSQSKEIELYQPEPIIFTQRSQKTEGLNEYAVLNGLAADVNLIGQVEEEFKSLFTLEDAELRLDYYEDDKLRCQLYNVAAVYEESYTSAPFRITCGWSCGISLLRRIPFEFPEPEDAVTHRYTQIDVIRHCIGQLNSELDIYTAIYTYPTTMQMDINNDPLAHVQVDIRTYQDAGEPFSCAQVIEKILVGYGARIGQSYHLTKPVWVIEEVNAKPYRLQYRAYKIDGSKAIAGPLPKRIIQSPSRPRGVWQINSAGSSKVQKDVVKQVILKKNLEFIPELIPDGDFGYAAWQNGGKDLKQWEKVNGVEISRGGYGGRDPKQTRNSFGSTDVDYTLKLHALPEFAEEKNRYVQSNGVSVFVENGNTFDLYIKCKFTFAGAGRSPTERLVEDKAMNDHANNYTGVIFDAELRFRVKIGNLYLSDSGTWEQEETDLSYRSKVFGSFLEFERTNISVPSDDQLQIQLLAPFKPYLDDNSHDDVDFYAEVDYIKALPKFSGGFVSTNETIYAEAPSFAKAKPFEAEIVHADVNTLQNISSLTVAGELTTLWSRYYGEQARTMSFAETLAQKILDNYISSDKWILSNFEFIVNRNIFSWHSVIAPMQEGMRDRNFICTDFTYNPRKRGKGTISGTWVEVSNANAAVTFKVKEEKRPGGSGGGGSNSFGTTTVQNPFDIKPYFTPKTVGTPIFATLHNGKAVIDADELGIPDGTVPDLQTVTGVHNETTIPIIVTSTSYETKLSPVGLSSTKGSLMLDAAQGDIFLNAGGLTAMSILQDRTALFYNRPLVAHKVAAFDSSGRLGEALPGNLITAGNNIEWSADGKTINAVVPTANNDYDLLNNKPIINRTGGIKELQGQLKQTFWSTAAAAHIVTVSSSDIFQKRTITELDLATKTWVNGQGFLKSIPIASGTELGGIKVGSGLTIDVNGVLSTSGGTADGNDYVDTVSFSSGTRVLTLGRTGTLADLTATIPATAVGLHTVSNTLAVALPTGNTLTEIYSYTLPHTDSRAYDGFAEIVLAGDSTGSTFGFLEVRLDTVVISRKAWQREDNVNNMNHEDQIYIEVPEGTGTRVLKIYASRNAGPTGVNANIRRMRLKSIKE